MSVRERLAWMRDQAWEEIRARWVAYVLLILTSTVAGASAARVGPDVDLSAIMQKLATIERSINRLEGDLRSCLDIKWDNPHNHTGMSPEEVE